MTRWVTVALVLTACGAARVEHPGRFDFGDVALFGERTATVQVSNPGPGTATLELLVSGAEFTADEQARSLEEGETALLRLRFSPTELGPREGTLTLRSGGHASTLALTGRGTGPRLSVRSEVFLEPIANVHGRPLPIVEVPLVVSNVGTAGSELHLEVPSPNSAEVCVGSFDGVGVCTPWAPPARIVAGEFVTVPVQVRPLSPGSRSWGVTFVSDDPLTRAQVVTLRALVEDLEPCILTSPGQVLLDTGPTPLTVTNRAAGTCLVRSAQLESTPSSAFRFADPVPAFPVRLAAGGQLTLWPVANFGAPRTATGVVHVMPEGGPVHDVSLAFVQVDPVSCLVASPGALDFGTVKQGCQGPARTIALYDTCSQPLTLEAVRLGAAAGQSPGGPACPGTAPCPEFFIVGGVPAGTTLQPGPTPVVVSVKYAPLDLGPDTGALVVELRDGGSQVVALQARGDSGGEQVDTFRNDALPVVDLLVMVDASPSFVSKRAEVRTKLAAWLSGRAFSCLDARVGFAPAEGAADAGVGFVLTDAGAPWASSLDPDFVTRALSAFDALPVGSETEACIGPAAALMQNVAPRDAGVFSTGFSGVCVTDALEQSPAPMAALAQLQARLSSPAMTTWSAVTGLASSSCAVEAVDDGVHASLVQASNGARDDLCAPSWAALAPIGIPTCGVRSSFFLTARPAGPLEVRVDGVLVPLTDWTWDAASNAVVFAAGHVPGPGMTIEVRYSPACVP